MIHCWQQGLRLLHFLLLPTLQCCRRVRSLSPVSLGLCQTAITRAGFIPNTPKKRAAHRLPPGLFKLSLPTLHCFRQLCF